MPQKLLQRLCWWFRNCTLWHRTLSFALHSNECMLKHYVHSDRPAWSRTLRYPTVTMAGQNSSEHHAKRDNTWTTKLRLHGGGGAYIQSYLFHENTWATAQWLQKKTVKLFYIFTGILNINVLYIDLCVVHAFYILHALYMHCTLFSDDANIITEVTFFVNIKHHASPKITAYTQWHSDF